MGGGGGERDDLVAHVVSVGVVHLFEEVDVGDEDRERLVETLRRFDLLRSEFEHRALALLAVRNRLERLVQHRARLVRLGKLFRANLWVRYTTTSNK